VDPSGEKPGDKYNELYEAAIAGCTDAWWAMSDAYKKDKSLWEFGTTIYQNADKTFSYLPIKTDMLEDKVSAITTVPKGTTIMATAHTHPPLPNYDSEHFSLRDKMNADQRMLATYLATPAGKIWAHDPDGTADIIATVGPRPQDMMPK
jgi:hypothetical protein